MAKNNFTAEQAKDALNEIMLKGESSIGLTYDQAFEILEKADSVKMKNLAVDYFNFEKPGIFNFVFEGMDKAEMENREIDVVMLRDKEGKLFINGNAVLVNSLKKVQQLPALVRVEYKGDVKSAKGTYKDLAVYSL